MLGKNLKEIRRRKGWSQQKLAEVAGLSYVTIAKIEQNRAKEPTIHSMIKIADALGVSIDEIVGRTPLKKK
jgi:transcriptional regulator with XRE-family HTH domain